MIIPDWVQKDETGKALNDIIIVVMKEFGYDIETMRKMPISTFMELVKKLSNDAKEQEREMRRLKR